jgi:hypothetical protein
MRSLPLESNFLSCCVYDPASNSSYSKELDHEILGHVEKEIKHFQKRGNVLMCGDFNAKVSSENDFIYQDSNNFLPLFKSYNFENMSPRTRPLTNLNWLLIQRSMRSLPLESNFLSLLYLLRICLSKLYDLNN